MNYDAILDDPWNRKGSEDVGIPPFSKNPLHPLHPLQPLILLIEMRVVTRYKAVAKIERPVTGDFDRINGIHRIKDTFIRLL